MKSIRLTIVFMLLCLFFADEQTFGMINASKAEISSSKDKSNEIEHAQGESPYMPMFWTITPLLLASIAFILLLASERKKRLKEIQSLKAELKKEKKLHQRDIETYKDKELSVVIIEQEKRNSLIEKIMIKLQRLRENFHEKQRAGFNAMLIDLDKMLDNQLWHEFEHSFTEIHPRYIKKLKAQYPDISDNEVKVCVLIRINLTSKEISKLTGLSVKSIEAIRTKLRKRFELMESNLLLNDFLYKFN